MGETLDAINIPELVQLCAVDSLLFQKTFFPRTVRQAPALYHGKVWSLLESNNRLVDLQVHRDGAKTSLLRMYTAKRIAYGLAHTILYIGKSENHALRSVKWIRKQVQFNTLYSSVFNLKPGSKWQDSEAEIFHGTDQYPITIVAMGITGSIRGINFDDFRPDLIVIDDVADEENSATLEQRQKIEDLVLGSLRNSLAPATESPDAKMVILQTPLNREDFSTKALTDPEFVSAVFGVWTEETKDLPLHLQESAWPARYPTATLRKEKEAAIQKNKLGLWLREKECKLISQETCDFLPSWLKYYELDPPGGVSVMSIDPVPPPSEQEIAKGFIGKDFEVLAIITKYQGNYYLRDYMMNRGHDPDWTIMAFFTLGMMYRPRTVLVEAVAYQRTLAWILQKAMQARRQFYVLKPFNDKRSKRNRILDGIQPLASNGKLYIKKEHVEFARQFLPYPFVENDDVIEAVANGCGELAGVAYMGDEADGVEENEGDSWKSILANEKDIPALEYDPDSRCP